MPEFTYRGRDKLGALRVGERAANTLDELNVALNKEGITPFEIKPKKAQTAILEKINLWLQTKSLSTEELSIFTRQMQLLIQASVPIDTALNQLASTTRNKLLAETLHSLVDHIAKGQGLATAMQHFPHIFSPLMVSIVQIGENSGRLNEAFGHLHHYLNFESRNTKQIKSALRYPATVFIAIIVAIFTINLFVIPTFARFYTNMTVSLPWQTKLLIGTSNFFVHYAVHLLIVLTLLTVFAIRYFRTPAGKYNLDYYTLKIPLFGKLISRMLLIRICQSLALILESGISLTQGLGLVEQIISNSYITAQMKKMQEAIHRGTPFTQAIISISLFTSLEIQILSVGEKSGELTPALNYIGNFHNQEIEYDLKRLNDVIGPALIAVVSILILVLALGVYLPIWNMVDAAHAV